MLMAERLPVGSGQVILFGNRSPKNNRVPDYAIGSARNRSRYGNGGVRKET